LIFKEIRFYQQVLAIFVVEIMCWAVLVSDFFPCNPWKVLSLNGSCQKPQALNPSIV